MLQQDKAQPVASLCRCPEGVCLIHRNSSPDNCGFKHPKHPVASPGAEEIARAAESFYYAHPELGIIYNHSDAIKWMAAFARDYAASLEARLGRQIEILQAQYKAADVGWDAAEARADKAETERDTLAQWKREMMEVSRLWDEVTKYLQDHFEAVDWGKTWQAAIIRRLDDRAALAASLRDVGETLDTKIGPVLHLLHAHPPRVEKGGWRVCQNPTCVELAALLTRLSTDTKEEK